MDLLESGSARYRVRLTLTEEMLGSKPSRQDVYDRYIVVKSQGRTTGLSGAIDAKTAAAAKAPKEAAPSPEGAAAEESAAGADNPADGAEVGYTVFPRDEHGLFLWDYQIKGYIKEAANTLKDHPAIKISNFRSKVDNFLFVRPRRVPLLQADGTRWIDAPKILERPLRAMTMQGPRVSLAKSDMLPAGTYLEFDIAILNDNLISKKVLDALFSYGEFKGLGQWRNGGYGAFTFKFVG